MRLLRPALPWILEHARGDERQSFFNDLACCLDNADQPLEAQQFHRRALECSLEQGRLDQASINCGNMTFSLKNVGRLRAALDSLQQARRYALGFDEARGTTYPLDLMTLALLRDLGCYAEAVRAAEVALQTSAGQDPIGVTAAHLHVAALWLHLGQAARTRQALAAAQAQPVAPHQRARLAQLTGQLLQNLGEPASAAFEQALADAPLTGSTALQSMIALDHAFTLPAAAALATCEQVLQRCDAIGLAGVALAARVRGALFAVRAGVPDRAAALARQVFDTRDDVAPDCLYAGERWRSAVLAFEAAGAMADARAAARSGRDWLKNLADEHVPAEFRDSFLHRNPVNRDLLALAARLTPR